MVWAGTLSAASLPPCRHRRGAAARPPGVRGRRGPLARRRGRHVGLRALHLHEPAGHRPLRDVQPPQDLVLPGLSDARAVGPRPAAGSPGGQGRGCPGVSGSHSLSAPGFPEERSRPGSPAETSSSRGSRQPCRRLHTSARREGRGACCGRRPPFLDAVSSCPSPGCGWGSRWPLGRACLQGPLPPLQWPAPGGYSSGHGLAGLCPLGLQLPRRPPRPALSRRPGDLGGGTGCSNSYQYPAPETSIYFF